MTTKKNKQQAKRSKRSIHGILLLDKPTGISSNKALQQVKYALAAAKAGHTGSLDPLASGLLPLCFGEATKISSYLLEADKSYTVTAKLGVKTNTGDSEGEVTDTQSVPDFELKHLNSVLVSFLGDSLQIPPMYSALKVDGQRLYKLARKGETVERKHRAIHIHSLEMTRFSNNELSLNAVVSKGTYIRSLIEDIAEKLGTIAHVIALRRTGVYPYENPAMISMQEFTQMTDEQKQACLIPIESALSHWKCIKLEASQASDLKHGKTVQTHEYAANELVLVKDENDSALAIGSLDAQGLLKTRRLFLIPSSDS
jgi:tRNA pseudouridine55 synthase